MKKNVYVTDLDGTLLNSKSKLAPETLEGLKEIIENNIILIFASARGSGSMMEVLNGVEIRNPLIECNGAYVTDSITRRHIGINRIRPETAEKVLDVFDEFAVEPMVSCNAKEKDHIYYSKYSNEAMERFFRKKLALKDDRIEKVETIRDALKGNVVSFNYIGRKSEVDRIHNVLYRECSDISAVVVDDHEFEDWYWLMINSKNATKASGIEMVLDMLEISDYHLTVFGDNLNDIPMFKLADYGVATENATEELKGMADEIIGSCDENSVVDFIICKEIIR